ncbi:hypothetical protein ACTFIY_001991 [Dictyostelium cf. discoideum]
MSKSMCLEKLSLTDHKDKSTLRVGELRDYIKRFLSENNNNTNEDGNCTYENLSVNLNIDKNSNINDSNDVSNVEQTQLNLIPSILIFLRQNLKLNVNNNKITHSDNSSNNNKYLNSIVKINFKINQK